MGEILKGFIFTIALIFVCVVLLGFAIFYFNYNESLKNLDLDLQEVRKVNFVVDNLSNNFSEILGLETNYTYNRINFIFNLNKRISKDLFLDLESFYENDFISIISGDLNITQNDFLVLPKIIFNEKTFNYDYNNKKVIVENISDLDVNLNINVKDYLVSKTNISYSSGGLNFNLDYRDYNGTYTSQGFITIDNCSNKQIFYYMDSQLEIYFCNDNLYLELVGSNEYDFFTNLELTQTLPITNPEYNIDLNYILGNSKYIGKLKAS